MWMGRMAGYRAISLLFFLALRSAVYGQPQASYPRMLFPINPGKPCSLTGNMGELRTNHFHGGLDIRTGYRTGLPVYASADGYVSFVQISSYGYGRMVHIKHPNGLVTVYAHLERFAPEVEAYARDQQRTQSTFEVELYPTPGGYKVMQGDVIGSSGNSGSSGGPHLHYEIRDTNDVVLNPMHFGFAEVVDELRPYMAGLAITPMAIESRVDKQMARRQVRIVSKRPGYYEAVPIEVHGPVGLELLARDRVNNGTQHTGITCLEMTVDGREVFYSNIDKFAFNQTGNINNHINYEIYKTTGERYQKCYKGYGSFAAAGGVGPGKGIITVPPGTTSQYRIRVYDAYGNSAEMAGTLIGVADTALWSPAYQAQPACTYSIIGTALVLRLSGPSNLIDSAQAYYAGKPEALRLSYTQGRANVYLINLQKRVPDSIGVPGQMFSLGGLQSIPGGVVHVAEAGAMLVKFRQASLFDTTYLTFRQQGPYLEIGTPNVALASPIAIRVNLARPPSTREAFYLLSGGRAKWLKPTVHGDTVLFDSRYLGKFALYADSTPPTARVVQAGRAGFRVLIGDNLSGIQNFRATLAGKPVALDYDHKRNLVWADEEEMDLHGAGLLEFSVFDNCGNEKRLTATIL